MTSLILTGLPCNFDGTKIETPTQLWGMYVNVKMQSRNLDNKIKSMQPLVVSEGIAYLKKENTGDMEFFRNKYGHLQIQSSPSKAKERSDAIMLIKFMEQEAGIAYALNSSEIDCLQARIKADQTRLEFLTQTSKGRDYQLRYKELCNKLESWCTQVYFYGNKNSK